MRDEPAQPGATRPGPFMALSVRLFLKQVKKYALEVLPRVEIGFKIFA